MQNLGDCDIHAGNAFVLSNAQCTLRAVQTPNASERPNRIEQLRTTRGLLRSQLAAELLVDQSTIYRWERSHAAKIPDAKKLELARLFKVDVAYLMGWDEKQAA